MKNSIIAIQSILLFCALAIFGLAQTNSGVVVTPPVVTTTQQTISTNTPGKIYANAANTAAFTQQFLVPFYTANGITVPNGQTTADFETVFYNDGTSQCFIQFNAQANLLVPPPGDPEAGK
jgi:hypothetical protein